LAKIYRLQPRAVSLIQPQRHVLGKPDREDWYIVAGKFRCNPRGEVDGYGLVALPK